MEIIVYIVFLNNSLKVKFKKIESGCRSILFLKKSFLGPAVADKCIIGYVKAALPLSATQSRRSSPDARKKKS